MVQARKKEYLMKFGETDRAKKEVEYLNCILWQR